jgi:hypothetical protein
MGAKHNVLSGLGRSIKFVADVAIQAGHFQKNGAPRLFKPGLNSENNNNNNNNTPE